MDCKKCARQFICNQKECKGLIKWSNTKRIWDSRKEKQMSYLDDEELLATRILNNKATFKEVMEYINKNHIKRKDLEEYLIKRIESVNACYYKEVDIYYDSDIGALNVSCLSKKEIKDLINKRNCLIVQKHCYEEILKKISNKTKED